VAGEAVAALGVIPDPAAARAIHTALRAATGAVRRAITDALVAERDPRVVPVLVRIIEESQPLGKDHELVRETVAALGSVGTDAAVPALVTLSQKRSFFSRKKARALKEACVDALARVSTEKSAAAIREAAATGDGVLRKIAAQRATG
jgi:HEAT repeat protein